MYPFAVIHHLLHFASSCHS